MDTSETYIKMRLAAIPDMGTGCKPRIPFHYITDSVHVDTRGNFYYSNAMDVLCQLERQDRLQEMIVSTSNRNKAEEFGNWVASLHNGWYPNFDVASPEFPNWSMEELWLAFVMKGKYGKVWTGEKWESVKVRV